MAPFSKKAPKKKGPKGKKGREKAKRDKHWGMKIDEDDNKSSRRKGKSRLLAQEQQKQELNGNNNNNNTNNPMDSEEENHLQGNTKYNKYQKSNKDRKEVIDSSTDDDDDESTDMDEFINNNTMNQTSAASYKNLLSRIIETGDATRNSGDDDVSASSSSDDDELNENEVEESASVIMEDDESSAENSGSDSGEDDDINKVDIDEDITLHNTTTPTSTESNNTNTTKEESALFTHHFAKPTFEKENELNELLIEMHQQCNLKKITPYLKKSSLEIHCSTKSIAYNNVLHCSSGGSSSKKKNHVYDLMKVGQDSDVGGVVNASNNVISDECWMELNGNCVEQDNECAGGVREKEGKGKLFSTLQTSLYASLSSYADLLCTIETTENRDDVYNIIIYHLLHHIITSNSLVQSHEEKITIQKAKQMEAEAAAEKTKKKSKKHEVPPMIINDDDDDTTNYRDQGFTKPKVLVLLPTRGTCLTFVTKLLKCLGSNVTIRNLDRFQTEFGVPEEENDDATELDKSERRRKSTFEKKGDEWNYFFGDQVNDDDDFRIGISITPPNNSRKKKKHKNATVHLYSDFYRSDLILASPLSMKMTTAASNNTSTNTTTMIAATSSNAISEKKDDDWDFLSSIEMCILCHSDVLLMQNWDHVIATMDCINQLPTGNNNDTDFSRVRDYFLAGQGCNWRQFILVSKFNDPNILSTFKRNAKSIEGEVRFRKQVPNTESSISKQVSINIPHVFQRVPCQTFQTQSTNCVDYFIQKILPPILRIQQKNTLIFIPSYFDFVSIRNAMMNTNANFVSVTEYARMSEINRGRSRFFKGYKNIMLYTGRTHFFKRYKIRGVKHVIFFGLPEYHEFYSEVVNWVNDDVADNEEDGKIVDSPPSCLSLYTKYDAHALERIVGTAHCERMISGDKNTYLFSS